MGLGVLYCVISKLKFYSKNNYQKTLCFKSVLLFSSIFNQSVLPAAELVQQLQLIFSHSRTTSLCESHGEFHYSIVIASMAILSCAVLFIESLFKFWNSHTKLFKLWDTTFFVSKYGTLTYSNYGTLKIFTHIMGHFKNHDIYSQNNVCLYMY